MMEEVFDKFLKEDLRHRLHVIAQHVADFWTQRQHLHFTYHGPAQIRQIQERLGQFLQEWSKEKLLSEDEIFVLFAASMLYDIGMQCTDLRPRLNIDWQFGEQLSQSQLLRIREKKHELTYDMILQSVSRTYQGQNEPLRLGLESDDYTRRIADVCLGCSEEPLVTGPDTMRGLVRVPLLVALLRLADQLYIVSERVDLELLQRAPLPRDQKIRWWLYHYTQALPIEQGQIPFRYSLPPTHRQFLGRIRTVIEQPFSYGSNTVIQFLWGSLPLVPHKKALVENDSPHITLYEMNPEMALELSRMPVNREYDEITTQQQARENRCLVVLDYENFLLQLGLEGHFPTLSELRELLPNLLIAARERFLIVVDGLACGHWERPDFRSAVALLQDMYVLLPLQEHKQGTLVLGQRLQEMLQSADRPLQLLLVAPPRAFATTAKQFQGKGQDIEAWISDTPDEKIFPALIHHTDSLTKRLNLAARPHPTQEELELTTASCILRLDEYILSNDAALSFEAVNTSLNQIEATQGKSEWWRLFLIHQGILTVEYREDRYTLQLQADHPITHATLHKRSVVIKAFQSLAPDGHSLNQRVLLEKLQNHEAFQDVRGHVLQFLHLLQQENILSVDTHPSIDEDYPLYQLNKAHRTVVAFNADSYLRVFVLGLDHALVQNGYPELREYTLNRHLSSYLDNTAMIQTTYQLALSRGWVKKHTVTREQGYRSETLVLIEPAYDLREVQEVLLNRDLLLKILFRKTKVEALQFDALWLVMSQISDFSLKRDELNSWLNIFRSNNLVNITRDSRNIGCNSFELCGDKRLVQLLLGRLNICSVVLAMRTLQAKNSELAKPASVIQQRIFTLSTHDRTLALWAIEYAKHVKLALVSPSPNLSGPQTLLYLNKHSIVQRLDHREKPACQALAALVRRLSRPHLNDGWVPQGLVIKNMEKERGVFGSTHEEFTYWINAAIHKHPAVLRDKPDPVRPLQILLQTIS